MLIPRHLQKGDKIAIVSPASSVLPEYIDGAAALLIAEGFDPVVMPHAKGPASGSFAACDSDRLADLTLALNDPAIRAIFCSRGGYGCNHIIDRIPATLITSDPKWLIGFSDISALHALWLSAGVVSLHAPMAKHLTLMPANDECTRMLIRTLKEGLPMEYILPSHPLNRMGEAEGIITGGNLAVINGLADTPFDPFSRIARDKTILFIEDIGENIYEVERMLIRLRLAGHLDKLAALIVGQFTEYRPDKNHPDMETMIAARVADTDFPVIFNFPAGHIDRNLPIPLGATAHILVTPTQTSLSFS